MKRYIMRNRRRQLERRVSGYKMKTKQIQGLSNYIAKTDIANIFNVYTKSVDGFIQYAYNLNRGLVIRGVNNIPAQYLDYYTVDNRDNLNLISYKVYGTINLWWLIAKINNITDATITLKPGRKLIIVGTDSVNKILNMLKS